MISEASWRQSGRCAHGAGHVQQPVCCCPGSPWPWLKGLVWPELHLLVLRPFLSCVELLSARRCMAVGIMGTHIWWAFRSGVLCRTLGAAVAGGASGMQRAVPVCAVGSCWLSSNSKHQHFSNDLVRQAAKDKAGSLIPLECLELSTIFPSLALFSGAAGKQCRDAAQRLASAGLSPVLGGNTEAAGSGSSSAVSHSHSWEGIQTFGTIFWQTAQQGSLEFPIVFLSCSGGRVCF